MRLKASVNPLLKDIPKGYLGIRSERYILGQKTPISFSTMIIQFIHVVSEFYGLFTNTEEMNVEMDVLRKRLEGMGFAEGEGK